MKTITILASLLMATYAHSEIKGLPDDSPVRGKWKLVKQTPEDSELQKSKAYKKMYNAHLAFQLKSSGMSDAEIKETIETMEVVNPGKQTTTYNFGENEAMIVIKGKGTKSSETFLFKISGKEIQVIDIMDAKAMKAMLPAADFAELQEMYAMKKAKPDHLIFRHVEFVQACQAKSFKVSLSDNNKKLVLASGPIKGYDNQKVRYEFVRAE